MNHWKKVRPATKADTALAQATILLVLLCVTVMRVDDEGGWSLGWPFYFSNNYYECLLKELPGTKDQRVFSTITSTCERRFPKLGFRRSMNLVYKIYQFNGHRIYGQSRVDECIIGHAKDEAGDVVSFIEEACNMLYSDQKTNR